MSENMTNVPRQNVDDEASMETIFHKRALSADRDENLTSRPTSISGNGDFSNVDSSTKMAKLEMTKNKTEERFTGSFNSSPTGREVRA